MKTPLLDKSIKVLLLALLSIAVLYYAKPFLVPVLIASFLSMLVLPLCMRLEKRLNKAAAVLLSLLLLVGVAAVIGYIISTQVSGLSNEAENIERNIAQKIQQVQEFATRSLGIASQQQQELLRQQQTSTTKIASIISSFFSSLGVVLTDAIIVLVYIFLFLYFRDHFKKFILKIIPAGEQANAQIIIRDVRSMAQRYLTGMTIMIGCLWIMYGIGFSIIGVKNALFYAVLCGLLEIVPYVGNLTGVSITVIMSLAQGGNTNSVIAIVVTYCIVQFLQTYILEPLVVGRGISVHPVFTIVGLVAGELLWGIPGLVLALPLMGVVKIICDHIEPLKPYGFLIGCEKISKNKVVGKVKKMF